MASPAIHPTRPSGLIDPRRPGEYPIILGESLKGSAKSKDSLVNIRYNWRPKSAVLSGESRLTKSGDKYHLLVEEGDSDNRGYRYTGTLHPQSSESPPGQTSSLALIFDKSKSAFVLESITASIDMNLKSGPGQSSKDARDLPQIPSIHQSYTGLRQSNGEGGTSPPAEDEAADPSNPYDFRHFLAEARENIEKSTSQPGNRTPAPPGSRTPMSGISTPVPGGNRFLATTPQFRATPIAKSTQQRKKKSEDLTSTSNRARAQPATKPGTTKRDATKPSSSKPLSKARISDSDDDDDETIDVSHRKPAAAKPHSSAGDTPPGADTRYIAPTSKGKGHTRNISANIGRSPHIIINDNDVLEIDMGSPPPEARARRGRVDPEMFRSHTGTPVAGSSSNANNRPLSRPTDEDHGHRDGGREVTMKDIEAESGPEDEDGDVEEFELGSPREKRLSVPNSGDVLMMEDDDDDDDGEKEEPHKRQNKYQHEAPTPPAPAVASNDEEDDEDLLAAELEAALDEEDEEAGRGVGLGIGMSSAMQDDESEVSEEE